MNPKMHDMKNWKMKNIAGDPVLGFDLVQPAKLRLSSSSPEYQVRNRTGRNMNKLL